jgi:hypothetical protein
MNDLSNELTSYCNHVRQTPPMEKDLGVQKNNHPAVEVICDRHGSDKNIRD